jgi:hypothetical protein
MTGPTVQSPGVPGAPSRAWSELRSALFAFLDADAETPASWQPLIDRLRMALDAVEAACQEAEPPLEALASLAAEFRSEAIRQGKERFARSPLYPWGVVGYLDALHRRLRFRWLVREHRGPCTCALVVEHGMYEMVDRSPLVSIGHGDDPLEGHEDYRCSACGALWRSHDVSTEQYSSYRWSPLRGGP